MLLSPQQKIPGDKYEVRFWSNLKEKMQIHSGRLMSSKESKQILNNHDRSKENKHHPGDS